MFSSVRMFGVLGRGACGEPVLLPRFFLGDVSFGLNGCRSLNCSSAVFSLFFRFSTPK